MIELRFDHIGLNVSDLDESIKFYADFFGFKVIERWDNPRQAFIGNGDITIGIMEVVGYDFKARTMAHIAFPCSKKSFKEAIKKVSLFELEIVAGPKQQRGGETILFRDPSGNIIEICYPALKDSLKK